MYLTVYIYRNKKKNRDRKGAARLTQTARIAAPLRSRFGNTKKKVSGLNGSGHFSSHGVMLLN